MSEQDYEYTLVDKKGNVWIDTRGSGLRMHGTSSALGDLYDDFYSTGNIYGQGFYTTDARDIAHGYTKKGKGESPSLYEIEEQKPVKLYDMNKPMSDKIKKIADETFGELLEDTLDNTGKISPKATLQEVFDDARAGSSYAGYTADDVQELFYGVRSELESEGYEGFKHLGGDKTNNKPHTVRIYWNPSDQIKIKEMPQDTFLVRGGGAGGKLLGLAGLLGVLGTVEDTYAQGKEQGLSDVAAGGVTAGKLAYDLFAPTISLLVDSPEVGTGSDVVPEGKMFIDPYVTGESMPQYTSLEPDSDLFKGSL